MESFGQAELDNSSRTRIDEEMLTQVYQGDHEAIEYIINKYERVVHKKANTYFLLGSDREDVVQEGLIGLYKAINDYDENKKSSFKSFAELCITRQIITSIKSATRLKHTPLNSYVSIYKRLNEEESERILLDTLQCEQALDPLDHILKIERYEQIRARLLEALTKLEREVLFYYIKGYTYEEIANEMKRQEKSIDNALQRVKRKVERLLQNNEIDH